MTCFQAGNSFLRQYVFNSVKSFNTNFYEDRNLNQIYATNMASNATCHENVPLGDINWGFAHLFPLPWSLGLYAYALHST